MEGVSHAHSRHLRSLRWCLDFDVEPRRFRGLMRNPTLACFSKVCEPGPVRSRTAPEAQGGVVEREQCGHHASWLRHEARRDLFECRELPLLPGFVLAQFAHHDPRNGGRHGDGSARIQVKCARAAGQHIIHSARHLVPHRPYHLCSVDGQRRRRGGQGNQDFYNTNDFALQRSVWQIDQLLKPDTSVVELSRGIWTYYYDGGTSDPAPWNNFSKQDTTSTTGANLTLSTSAHKPLRSHAKHAAEDTYTTSLGATAAVHHLADSIDLSQIWLTLTQAGTVDYAEHFWHSAEFRGDNSMMQRLLERIVKVRGIPTSK